MMLLIGGIIVLVALILCVAIYITWVAIHEYSHLAAVKLTCGMYDWDIKILPHDLDGTKVDGSLTWAPKRVATSTENAIISLAPCVLSLMAVILFPIAAMFSDNFIIILFCYFGVFDLVGNALVTYNYSNDFNSAARALNISRWKLTLPIIIAGALSTIIGIVALGFRYV